MVGDEEQKNFEEPASYNMAGLFYIHLNELWARKDEAYLNNNIELWYKYLNRMFVKIQFKLKLEEEEYINGLLEDAKVLISRHIDNSEISPKLMEVDKQLVKLLHKYKMIFPNIDMTFGLKKVDERYKLGVKK